MRFGGSIKGFPDRLGERQFRAPLPTRMTNDGQRFLDGHAILCVGPHFFPMLLPEVPFPRLDLMTRLVRHLQSEQNRHVPFEAEGAVVSEGGSDIADAMVAEPGRTNLAVEIEEVGGVRDIHLVETGIPECVFQAIVKSIVQREEIPDFIPCASGGVIEK